MLKIIDYPQIKGRITNYPLEKFYLDNGKLEYSIKDQSWIANWKYKIIFGLLQKPSEQLKETKIQDSYAFCREIVMWNLYNKYKIGNYIIHPTIYLGSLIGGVYPKTYNPKWTMKEISEPLIEEIYDKFKINYFYKEMMDLLINPEIKETGVSKTNIFWNGIWNIDKDDIQDNIIQSFILEPQNICIDSYNLLIIRAFMQLNYRINFETIDINNIKTKEQLYETLQQVEPYFTPTMQCMEYYSSLPKKEKENKYMYTYNGIINFLRGEYKWTPDFLNYYYK